jgi:ketosteroid isomerase-like protein
VSGVRWYTPVHSSTMRRRDAAGEWIMSEAYYATSKDAEQAFYDAFQGAAVDDMMKIWSPEDSIICIHPMGPRLEGREAVAQSWRQIFSGGAPIRFELTEVSCIRDGTLAVHCVYENIDHGSQLRQRSLVLSTNVYQCTERGWNMLVHHASPAISTQTADKQPRSTVH